MRLIFIACFCRDVIYFFLSQVTLSLSDNLKLASEFTSLPSFINVTHPSNYASIFIDIYYLLAQYNSLAVTLNNSPTGRLSRQNHSCSVNGEVSCFLIRKPLTFINETALLSAEIYKIFLV